MKKILLVCLLMCLCADIYAQDLVQFNKAYTHRVVYDDDFYPTLVLKLNNISFKVITSVEVTVEFGHYELSTVPYASRKYIRKITIYPGQSMEFSYDIDKDVNERKPAKFYISGIRYSDGTVCVK